jgi:tetratricopeptide (TPR) repeat protein
MQMNCSKCNSPLGAGQFCAHCGLKEEHIKKACNTADYYYNEGLLKASIRDLYGAKEELKTALFFNKYHIDARNLLGLLHYETGEISCACANWKASLAYSETNNPAQRYLKEAESGKEFEDQKQAIRKYNLALQYARQGSEDLALIQIKKVVTLAPKFIDGQLLLALLYLHAGKNDEAEEILETVLKIDCFHPIAVRYYQELTGDSPNVLGVTDGVSRPKVEEKKVKMPDLSRYVEPASGNSNLIISLVIGMVIGVVAMWVLIMPNQRFNVSSDYKALQVEYKETVAAKDASISQLEEDKANLESENKTLSDRLEVYAGTDGEDGMYDALLKSASLYASGNTVDAAKALLDVDADRLESDTAKDMYKKLKKNTFESASSTLYSEGYSAYNKYQYEEAKSLLKDAYTLNKDNANALYFLARSYDRLGETKKAIKYYKKVIKNFPNSSRATEAEKKLNELGVTVEKEDATTEATEE